MEGKQLNDERTASSEDVQAVIGRVVSSLIIAGKPIYLQEIAAMLMHQANEATDPGLKKHCLEALRLIADKMN
ncbi:hypothetical protein [Serratia sp. M24T3]|uniref:hypothetical protein n=1 Tax=Serratia sp. M24T3 TaxID=932213 RepID=UPI00055C5129|nr:hypothetical protein [Serratia sp. M24T3]